MRLENEYSNDVFSILSCSGSFYTVDRLERLVLLILFLILIILAMVVLDVLQQVEKGED